MGAVGQNDTQFDVLVVYGPLYKNLKSYGRYIHIWELIGSALTIQACDCNRVKGQALSFWPAHGHLWSEWPEIRCTYSGGTPGPESEELWDTYSFLGVNSICFIYSWPVIVTWSKAEHSLFTHFGWCVLHVTLTPKNKFLSHNSSDSCRGAPALQVHRIPCHFDQRRPWECRTKMGAFRCTHRNAPILVDVFFLSH